MRSRRSRTTDRTSCYWTFRSRAHLGWISPGDGVMEPQWTFGWSATGVRSHVFASLLCLPERKSDVDIAGNRVDPDGTGMRLEWSMDGRRHLLELERKIEKGLNIDYADGTRRRNL